MEIKPNEIAEITTVGKLFGDDVKLVRTTGGFHVFVGKKEKKSKEAQALAGTSHPAIGLHRLQKDFGADFQPALAKSESPQMPEVIEKSSYLPKEDLDKGLDLYVLKSDKNYAFILYKQGLTLGKYIAKAEGDELTISKKEFSYKGSKGTAKAIAKALEDVAYENGCNSVAKGDVIDLAQKRKEKGAKAKAPKVPKAPKAADIKPSSDHDARLERIRTSLNRINKLMAEHKKLTRTKK